MKTCDTCRANKVCDYDCYGFEDCGNYIPENIFKRLSRWVESRCKVKYKVEHSETKSAPDVMSRFYSPSLLDNIEKTVIEIPSLDVSAGKKSSLESLSR